jgi:hypothetical protein
MCCAPGILRSQDRPALEDRPGREGVTFNKDVAPIVFANCAPCHRPGESAPFSLLTFKDVRSRATLIADATARRFMPPWKPAADGGGPFSGSRALTDEQIGTIARWVEQGMIEGDSADLPPVPPPTDGWQMGRPDLVVTMAEAFKLPAEGADVFRTFVVSVPITATRYVVGLEFRSGGSRAVHHANIRVDPMPGSRELDTVDPLPGYEGGVSATARYPQGYVLGWTPGQRPLRSVPGMAWRIDPGTDLVVQLHLQKTGKPEEIRPSIGFVFTDEAPTQLPIALRLGRQNIDIGPGQQYVVRDQYTLPVDVELYSIHPHAHYRATDVRAFAELPGGTRRPLIHIPDWDFNWQDVYRYETPLSLPRDTTIVMEYAYDNSVSNVRNPDRPPRRVIWGQNSSDEMGDLWLQIVTQTAEDRARLVGDSMPKALAEDTIGYGVLLAADPSNEGLKRGKASTHYNLGTMLAADRRWQESAVHLQTVVDLVPDRSDAHNNLGVALRALGRVEEAIEHFRRAAALNPSNSAARDNLEDTLKLTNKP